MIVGLPPSHEHTHDDEPLGLLEANPIWQQDNVTLKSVGIDIGSSGTQVLFAVLHLRRISEDMSTRYVVVRRDTTYRSPVSLTPYLGADLIDAGQLGGIIDRAYSAAAVDPSSIDTGVVILTGQALRRRNARLIADVLAERGGDLVTATAGHNMEAMLAAYGSGAARVAYESGQRILNIDIGGGTTKMAVVDRGQVTATAAVEIGGRLHVTDTNGRLTRLDPAGAAHAARAGCFWEVDQIIDDGELERVAESMADALVTLVMARPDREDHNGFLLTDPLSDLDGIQGVMFSGGVAEYVYGRETRDFGDLGPRLGAAIRSRLDSGDLPFLLLPAGECIRATALGASEYSVQLSGNTGVVSDPDALLPRRNLQVVRPVYDLPGEVDPEEVSRAIRAHLIAFDISQTWEDVALALTWEGPPTYERLSSFARGIAHGLGERSNRGQPLYLLLDGDVAMTLGHLLRDELGVMSPLLVIDGLSLWDFDYVDLGRIRQPSHTVPVTIKSLVFEQDLRRR